MSILTPRPTYAPFEYQQAYKYWELQQQSHWLHCVGPNEMVFTSEGVFSVIDLYNKKNSLILFNGTKFVESSPMIKTGHRELFKIKTKEGYTHTVTKDHRVMTKRGWVEAQDLKNGDELIINTKCAGFGKREDRELAFLIGHYQGDGTTDKDKVIFDVWKHEFGLIPFIEQCIEKVYKKYNLNTERYNIPSFSKTGEIHRRCNSMKLKQMGCFVKSKVPDFIWTSNQETILSYIKGLFYTDGTVYQSEKHESIKFTQINKDFIHQIQLLLLLFGIKSCIYEQQVNTRLMPDGKGELKEYNCKTSYVLEITHKNSVAFLEKNIEIFKHRKKQFRGFLNESKSHPITTVRFTELESIGFSDVFCVSVFADDKSWICNGFVTHNTEISMASDINDWKLNLTNAERNVIGHILKGFTQSEVFIQDYWSSFISRKFRKPEIQMMSAAFASMESIHAVAYAYLNQSLGLEDFSAFLYEPTAKAKIDRLINTQGKSKEEIAKSLAVFSAFNEGVNLFSSFAILLNFSRFNKLKGVGQIIAFSIKDESLHSEAGCWLFRTLVEEYPEVWTDQLKQEIYDAARLTIELEDNFIDKAFELGPIEGLDPKDLKAFLRFRANTKLNDLNLKANWKNIDKDAIQRMEWFDVLSAGVNHADFFSQRISDYSKGVFDWTKIW